MADKISREEFEKQAIAGLEHSVASLAEIGLKAIPCDCEWEKCQGWRVVFIGIPNEACDGS